MAKKKDIVGLTKTAITKGDRRIWKLREMVSNLQTWSEYLNQSALRFGEELERFNSDLIFLSPVEKLAHNQVKDSLLLMKKESALLKNRSRRLHGQRP